MLRELKIERCAQKSGQIFRWLNCNGDPLPLQPIKKTPHKAARSAPPDYHMKAGERARVTKFNTVTLEYLYNSRYIQRKSQNYGREKSCVCLSFSHSHAYWRDPLFRSGPCRKMHDARYTISKAHVSILGTKGTVQIMHRLFSLRVRGGRRRGHGAPLPSSLYPPFLSKQKATSTAEICP
jgi:hypothetical protein